MAKSVSAAEVWRDDISWAELRRGMGPKRLEADEVARRAIARFLELEVLSSFKGTVGAKPWLDGVDLFGHLEAKVTRVCGVSLEPFEQTIEEGFRVRVVPSGSSNIWVPPGGEDVSLDLDGDDPPEVLTGDRVDLAALLVEQLALALPPFPRKPGAVFESPDHDAPLSPFAALAELGRRSSED